MGPEAGLAPRGFDRAIAQAARRVEPAEQQTGATHRTVCPAAIGNNSAGRVTVEKLLGLPNPVQRLVRLADLSERPSGGGDRPRNLHSDICSPEHRDPA